MNKMRNTILSLASVSLVALAGVFAGCSDDSSSGLTGASAAAPSSASTAVDPATGAPTAESSNSDVVPPIADVDENGNPTGPIDQGASAVTTNLAVTPDADGFYYIADVYKALPATSKVAFVIRHSERQSCESQESKLTAEGIAHAQTLGADIGGTEPFYYTSTDFIRTRETASNIAAGRGETAEVVTWDAINGSYFLKISSSSFDELIKGKGSSWKIIAQWAYEVPISNAYVRNAVATDTVFYNLMERGKQFVDEIVLANLPNWKRVNFLVTHDVLIEPLVVYATNRTIDVKFYESQRWVNYMTGIAVVVDDAGAVSMLPVRGYEVGWIGPTKSTTTCPEDAAAGAAQ